jgi:predicted DsbA family dithiol-disulfide isomerase
MTVRIWSDVRCPFCYIGKRKFEGALEQFPHKDKVNVIWHSFQLDPKLTTQPGLHSYDYLGRIKGLDREQVVEMHEHVASVGREVDINFDFERAIVANSFNAHRLIQMAKTKGLANAVEEELFKAHFTEGRNIDDHDTLIAVGTTVGLPVDEVRQMLASDLYTNEVMEDEAAARAIGIRGVPFFIIDDRLAVSGAQASELFLRALNKACADAEIDIVKQS